MTLKVNESVTKTLSPEWLLKNVKPQNTITQSVSMGKDNRDVESDIVIKMLLIIPGILVQGAPLNYCVSLGKSLGLYRTHFHLPVE